jgi:4-hydroxy-tetrahydrodipicolinate synthase
VFGGAGARYITDELARGRPARCPAIELADSPRRAGAGLASRRPAEARRLYTGSLPILLFQAVFRVRATKEVLRRRGLLASTVARAAGPVLDQDDLLELDALLLDARPLFTTHLPDSDARSAA